MKKFRKWLIHKLGGITKEEAERLNRPLNYILSESQRNVKRIYCSQHIKFVINSEEEFAKIIKEAFLSNVLIRLKEDYKPKLTRRFDDETGIYTYGMVFEYLEPKEDKN